MATPQIIEARESVALASPGDARVIVGDAALEAAGYDPSIYHAVVPAEGMRGGKINENGRIYGPPSEVAEFHMGLVRQAREGYVGGWKGHGLAVEEHDYPVDAIRLVDGDVVAMEDGSNLERCLVGILKTSRGNDVNTMWRAGKQTGLSLDGIVSAQEHTITAASPYAAMNPEAIGRTVELRRFRALNKYDVVFDPSFRTFFAPPPGVTATESVVAPDDSPEVHAAADRLRAAGAVIESTTRPLAAQEKTEMDPKDIKDIAALEAIFPGLVKDIREGAKAQSATEATAVAVQAAADRERVVALETANTETKADLKAATEALAKVRADLARAAVVGEIRKAVESWQVGKPGAPVISALVLAQAEAGSFTTAEEATKAADQSLKVALEVAKAVGAPVQESVASRANLTGIVDATEGTGTGAARQMTALDVFTATAGTA